MLDAAGEANLSIQWLAGLAWAIVAILGVAVTSVFVVSIMFAFAAPAVFFALVFVPGLIAFGIWVQRSVFAALGGALLGAVVAAVAIVGNGSPLVVAMATILGVLAALAAREIRNANVAASASRSSTET